MEVTDGPAKWIDGMYWRVTFQCLICNALVTFQNQRPDWQFDAERANIQETAKQFARKWIMADRLPEGTPLPQAVEVEPTGEIRATLIGLRWFPCPVCDSAIRMLDEHETA